MRNRRGAVVGLTCRVGRAVRGTVALIRDVVEQGRSILILGRPGVGKTTLLREAARVLADELGKRVVVVDTSNEIAGDGDVPHPGIGRARRMQVARPAAQHAVMIEAVENHMPEVVVIDEIGTEMEALGGADHRRAGGAAGGHGARAHAGQPDGQPDALRPGRRHPGGDAGRRGGAPPRHPEDGARAQAPPTFDVLIEQEERHLVGIHHDVAEAVDDLLRGEAPQREMRERQPDGTIRRWVERAPQCGTRRRGRSAGAAKPRCAVKSLRRPAVPAAPR